MNKKDDFKLIEGSRYTIISIGGRDCSLETDGVFRGYAGIGIDEAGLLMELTSQDKEAAKLRIIPLHAILAIDVYDVHDGGKEEEKKETNLYYS